MCRFIRHMAFFFLPVLAVAIVLEIVAESIPNSYIYKQEYMEQKGAMVQTLILGSSNAYDGLNPSVLSDAFNLANSSQTLEDDYRLLEQYIGSMDSLQTVIVGLSYSIWADASEVHRRTYYTIYMDLYPRWPLNKYSFEVFNLELLTKKIIKYAVSRDVTRCDSLGQRVGHTAAAVKAKKEFWNKEVETLTENDRMSRTDMLNESLVLNENFRFLHSIIELCEAHHVQPVIVTMPVMTEYKEALPPEQIAFHDSIMHTLPSSAIYIDASDWDMPDDGWYNATHLTREASVEFTERLMGKIE